MSYATLVVGPPLIGQKQFDVVAWAYLPYIGERF